MESLSSGCQSAPCSMCSVFFSRTFFGLQCVFMLKALYYCSVRIYVEHCRDL
uniref:Uncharacterized protein n=1 Tax=Arundo donax TaxID=35708 RepID=A0A0A8XYR0_ARUDO